MKQERLKIEHNKVVPAKGKLLIAEPFLSEAWFQRSVILLAEHNAEGSMGFVVNKPLDLNVNDFFEELGGVENIPLYCGGPVETNRLFYFHCLGKEIVPNSLEIGEGIYFDGDFSAICDYLAGGRSVDGTVKFFLGYSGWEKGQLSSEIKRDTWLVSSLQKDLVFDVKPAEVWDKALKQLGAGYSLWSTYPLDPSHN